MGLSIHRTTSGDKNKEREAWFKNEFPDLVETWRFICSKNGWKDNHIAVEWLNRIFLLETIPEDESDARLLILDGYGSYATVSITVLYYFIKKQGKICKLIRL